MLTVSTIVGWVFLILSWIAPSFIKDKLTKRFVGAILSIFATGIFLGALIQKIWG